jgi:hypothetical protein
MDDRPLIAEQFRQLASEYEAVTHPMVEYGLDDRAGKLTIAAFHRGYLADVPGLASWIEWVEKPPEHPSDGRCWLVPCASNLFGQLCGNHLLDGQKQADGTWKIISDKSHGGILPSIYPDLLPGHRVGAQPEAVGRDKQRAVICRWLAAEVERTRIIDSVGSQAKLSPAELAKKHDVPHDRLRKRLDRWRYEHDSGYVEVSNAARNEPRYLYDESAVMSVISGLKAKPPGTKRAADGQQKKI